MVPRRLEKEVPVPHPESKLNVRKGKQRADTTFFEVQKNFNLSL